MKKIELLKETNKSGEISILAKLHLDDRDATLNNAIMFANRKVADTQYYDYYEDKAKLKFYIQIYDYVDVIHGGFTVDRSTKKRLLTKPKKNTVVVVRNLYSGDIVDYLNAVDTSDTELTGLDVLYCSFRLESLTTWRDKLLVELSETRDRLLGEISATEKRMFYFSGGTFVPSIEDETDQWDKNNHELS